MKSVWNWFTSLFNRVPLLNGQVWGLAEDGELYEVPDSEVPDILRKRHDDYWWILKNIPRAATALVSNEKPTLLVYGGPDVASDPTLDILDPGNWAIVKTPLGWYFTVTFWDGWHFSFGPRYDYVDEYYQVLRLALKKIKFNGR